MPNGDRINDAMEFENHLNELHGDELTKFVARQLYEHCSKDVLLGDRLQKLEDRDMKFLGMVGGGSGIIGGAITAFLNWVTTK